MSESLVVKQAQFVTPPRSSGSATAASVGEVATFSTSTAAGYIELDTLFQQKVYPITPTQPKHGVT